MRVAYLDEAGTSGGGQEPVLVVAGIIVSVGDQERAIERRLLEIRDQYVKTELRSDFAFHAADGYLRGSKPKGYRKEDGWTKSTSVAVAQGMNQIILDFNLPTVYRSIDKRTGRWPECPIVQQVVAFSAALMMIEDWMRKHATYEKCTIVAEDTSDAVKSALIEQQRDLQTKYLSPSTLCTQAERALLPLTTIKGDVSFRLKADPLLQLADHVCYSTKRRLMKPSEKRHLSSGAIIQQLVARHFKPLP